MSLCVIVPRLPPVIDGVGDHTICLWKALFAEQSPCMPLLHKSSGWSFLVRDSLEETCRLFPEATIASLPVDSPTLTAKLESAGVSTVLLQFVGYGYSSDGAPGFLAHGLRAWKKANPDRRLITMFHELYATAPIWRKTFWHSFKQRELVNDLAALSDVSIVSSPYAAKILHQSEYRAIRIIPVGSNFYVRGAGERNFRSLLIFGLDRLQVIHDHRALLKLMTEKGLIDQIVLAGRYQENEERAELKALSFFDGERVVVEKNIPSSDLPTSLTECGLALSHVGSLFLHKSGRFHFSASLGQVFIAKRSASPPGEPLHDGIHFLSYNNPGDILSVLQDPARLGLIGDSARKLYQQHFSWESISAQWQLLLPLNKPSQRTQTN